MKLTQNQRETLSVALMWNGTLHGDKNDRTCRSLERRGLLYWSTGQKYSMAHWVMTPAGFEAMGVASPYPYLFDKRGH